VGNSIANTNIRYFDEKELSANLSGQGKLVDYLLVHEGSKILVDAKGVEMSYLGMVGHQPEVITDKTRTSIVKGIQQGFETVSRLGNIKKLGEVEFGKADNYLIVVTFKDVFVGNGLDFYENVAKGTLNELMGQYGGGPPIPFEHMYFMSIDDFDLLTGGIASGDIALTQILLHAVKSDALGATKKFTFGQHIYDMYPKQKPPLWLLDESKYILDRCKVRFGEED